MRGRDRQTAEEQGTETQTGKQLSKAKRERERERQMRQRDTEIDKKTARVTDRWMRNWDTEKGTGTQPE